MQMKYKYMLASVLGFTATAAGAQESLTLQQLIDRALLENYQVKIVANEAAIAENNNTLGNAGFLPSVDASAGQTVTVSNIRQEFFTGDVREGSNAMSTATNALVAANWTIFDGFMMFARRDQLGLLEELGQVDAKYYIEQTVADIATTYYQLIREHALLENYREALAISRFRYDLEHKKRSIGTTTGLFYNQARADYFADSIAMIRQENVIKTLEIQVNQLINDSLDQQLNLAQEEVPIAVMDSKENITQAALESNRDVKRAMIEELIAETNVKIAQAARYPEVNLFANYNYSRQVNEVGLLQSSQNVGPSVGVNIRLNLYNGGNVNRVVQNAGMLRENAALASKSTGQLIESAVLQLYYLGQAGMEQLAIARERENAATSSMNIAQKQYEAGVIDGFDFRQVQVDVINARNEVSQLEFTIKSAQIELARLSGKLMEVTL